MGESQDWRGMIKEELTQIARLTIQQHYYLKIAGAIVLREINNWFL